MPLREEKRHTIGGSAVQHLFFVRAQDGKDTKADLARYEDLLGKIMTKALPKENHQYALNTLALQGLRAVLLRGSLRRLPLPVADRFTLVHGPASFVPLQRCAPTVVRLRPPLKLDLFSLPLFFFSFSHFRFGSASAPRLACRYPQDVEQFELVASVLRRVIDLAMWLYRTDDASGAQAGILLQDVFSPDASFYRHYGQVVPGNLRSLLRSMRVARRGEASCGVWCRSRAPCRYICFVLSCAARAWCRAP